MEFTLIVMQKFERTAKSVVKFSSSVFWHLQNINIEKKSIGKRTYRTHLRTEAGERKILIWEILIQPMFVNIQKGLRDKRKRPELRTLS